MIYDQSLNIATTDEVKTLLGHEDFVLSIAWSPNGKWLASGGQEYRLIVWDIEEETIRSSAKIDTSFYGVSWSPDEKYVAASTRDAVLIIDPATGTIEQELPAGEGDNGGSLSPETIPGGWRARHGGVCLGILLTQ
jgi:WD40 repeat protein